MTQEYVEKQMNNYYFMEMMSINEFLQKYQSFEYSIFYNVTEVLYLLSFS